MNDTFIDILYFLAFLLVLSDGDRLFGFLIHSGFH